MCLVIVAGCCECGDELSASVKCKFIDYLRNYWLIKRILLHGAAVYWVHQSGTFSRAEGPCGA